MTQIDYNNLTDFDRHVMLARMANFMEDLPRERCVMEHWCAPDATDCSCGSAGCFAGWTAAVHKSAGWKFYRGRGKHDLRTPLLHRRSDDTVCDIADFFALTLEATMSLTHGQRFPVYQRFPAVIEWEPLEFQTPRDVARRIRAVVAHIDPKALEAASTDTPATKEQVR